MFENRGKGVKRNDAKMSDERPTKTPRNDREDQEVQTQNEIPGQGRPIPSGSLPSYAKINTYGTSRISMNFEGETGHAFKESFIESIQSCPTDLDLICSDGVAFAHRFILMGVSDFFYQLLFDRDMKDTEAITLVNVSIVHLLPALELIYSGRTIVKGSDEDALQGVLKLFKINMKLERNEATEQDLADTLQESEVPHDDDDKEMQIVEEGVGTSGNEAENAKASKNNASAVEELDGIDEDLGSATDNETEKTGVVEANVNHQVSQGGLSLQPQQMEMGECDSEVDEENDAASSNRVDKENDSLPSDNETGKDASDSDERSGQDGGNKCDLVDPTSNYEEDENCNRSVSNSAADVSSLDESEGQPQNPMSIAEARPGQFDLHEPYPTEGHITLNGKEIRWHLMEALPSLTSPELRTERMRVFTLDIFEWPNRFFEYKVRNLYKSLPDNSIEKRLGLMAVSLPQGDNEEVDLVELLQPCKPACKCKCKYEALDIKDVELVGIPSECANLVTKMDFNARKSASKPTAALKKKMMKEERARYNLENYQKIIYGNVPIKEDKLLETCNIEGLEDRAKAVIKINVAGRSVVINRAVNRYLGWREGEDPWMWYSNPSGLDIEIGGIGWDVWEPYWKEDECFILNVTGTQILFPTLVRDVHLAKKVVEGQIKKASLQSNLDRGVTVAALPNCLLENGISCFPVVQKPGMLIYKYNDDDDDDINKTWVMSKLRLDMGAEIELSHQYTNYVLCL